MKTINDQINEIAKTIRPYLQRDGGDFEVVSFENGVIKIRFLSKCSGCHSNTQTLKMIEDIFMEEIPGIYSVIEVK